MENEANKAYNPKQVENLEETKVEESPKKKHYMKRGDIKGLFHQGDKVSLKGLPFTIIKVTTKALVFKAEPFSFEVGKKVE